MICFSLRLKLNRFRSYCVVTHPTIILIFQCHWIWCTFVSPKVAWVLVHDEREQPYVRQHRLCSHWRIKVGHVIAAWMSIISIPKLFFFSIKDSGKTRFGVCVNFYRPVERYVPSAGGSQNAASSTLAKRARNSALRRESWRKSMEKSSDSAFSRQVLSSHLIHLNFRL